MTTRINHERINRIFQRIEDEPERWNQHEYVDVDDINRTGDVCGTSFCFGGHALIDAGYHFQLDAPGDGYFVSPGGCGVAWADIDGEISKVLGLSLWGTMVVVNCYTDDLDELREKVDKAIEHTQQTEAMEAWD